METETQTTVPERDRKWGLFCHLSGFLGFIIPLGNVLGPLLIWLLKKQEIPAVNYHGKEALNFQIAVTIYMLVSALLTLIVIGFLLMIVVGIGAVVLMIIAAIKANDGIEYRYPMIFRLV